MSAEPAEKAPGSVAAQEELGILDRLSRAVWTKISELAKRPSLGGNLTHTELSLREQRYSTLKGFEELADQSYGRTVAGQEIEEDGRPRAPFKFRITQANVGYVEDGCFVLARNLP